MSTLSISMTATSSSSSSIGKSKHSNAPGPLLLSLSAFPTPPTHIPSPSPLPLSPNGTSFPFNNIPGTNFPNPPPTPAPLDPLPPLPPLPPSSSSSNSTPRSYSSQTLNSRSFRNSGLPIGPGPVGAYPGANYINATVSERSSSNAKRLSTSSKTSVFSLASSAGSGYSYGHGYGHGYGDMLPPSLSRVTPMPTPDTPITPTQTPTPIASTSGSTIITSTSTTTRSRSSSLSNSIASSSLSHSQSHDPTNSYGTVKKSSHVNNLNNITISGSGLGSLNDRDRNLYTGSQKTKHKTVRDSAASLLSLDMAVRTLAQLGGGKEKEKERDNSVIGSTISSTYSSAFNGGGDTTMSLSASTSSAASIVAAAASQFDDNAANIQQMMMNASKSKSINISGGVATAVTVSAPSATAAMNSTSTSISRSTSFSNSIAATSASISPPLSPTTSSTFSHASYASGSASTSGSASGSDRDRERPAKPTKPLPPPPPPPPHLPQLSKSVSLKHMHMQDVNSKRGERPFVGRADSFPVPNSTSSASALYGVGSGIGIGVPPSTRKERAAERERQKEKELLMKAGKEREREGMKSPDISDIIQTTPRPSRSLSRPQSRASVGTSVSISTGGRRERERLSRTSSTYSAKSNGGRGVNGAGKRRASSPGRFRREKCEENLGELDRSGVGEDSFVSDYGDIVSGGRFAGATVGGEVGESDVDIDGLERDLLGISANDKIVTGGGQEDYGGEESDSGSSIDLHTPLPRIMLREGVLSPHSKLLASDRGLTLGSGLLGGRESVVSQLSSMSMSSNITSSGLYKDERDTTKRRTRHRDGNLLKDGRGLTTGLGWSDSEDEDAPSPLTRRISKLTLSRNASMASMRSLGTKASNGSIGASKSKNKERDGNQLRSVRSLPPSQSMRSPHPLSQSQSHSTLARRNLDGVEENDEDANGPWTAPANTGAYSPSITGAGTASQVVNYSLPLLPRDEESDAVKSAPLMGIGMKRSVSSSTSTSSSSANSASKLSKISTVTTIPSSIALSSQSPRLEPPTSYRYRSRSPTPTIASATTASSTSFGFPGTPLDSTGEISEVEVEEGGKGDDKLEGIVSGLGRNREAYVDDGRVKVIGLDEGVVAARASSKPESAVTDSSATPTSKGLTERSGGSGGARSKTPTAMRMRTIPGARNRALSASAGVTSTKYRSSSETDRDQQTKPIKPMPTGVSSSSSSPKQSPSNGGTERLSTTSISSSSVPRPLRLPSLLYTQPGASQSTPKLNLQPGQPEKKPGQLLQGYNRNLHDSQRKRTLSQGSAMANNSARSVALRANINSTGVPLPTPSPTFSTTSTATTPELTGGSKIAKPTFQRLSNPSSFSSSLPSPAPSPILPSIPSPNMGTKSLMQPRTGTGMTYRTSSLPTSRGITGNITRIKSSTLSKVTPPSGIARKVST